MTGTATRLLVLTVIVVGISFATSTMREGGRPNAITLPKGDATAIPNEFGQWSGEETKLDEKLFKAIGATTVADRKFTNASGNTIALHVAVFQEFTVEPPHSPVGCYTNSGWSITDRKAIQLNPEDKSAGQAQLLSLERGGQHIFVLYWYHFGNTAIYDAIGARKPIWSLRGKPEWPSMIKIMLQTSAPSEAMAEETMMSLVRPLLKWSGNLQEGKSLEEVDAEVDEMLNAESATLSEPTSDKLGTTPDSTTQDPTKPKQEILLDKSVAPTIDSKKTTLP